MDATLNAQARDLLEAGRRAPAALLVVSSTGRVHFQSEHAAKVLGQSEDDLAHRGDFGFLHIEDRPVVRAALVDMRPEDPPLRTRVRIVDRTGVSHPVTAMLRPLDRGLFVFGFTLEGQRPELSQTAVPSDPLPTAIAKLNASFLAGETLEDLRHLLLRTLLEATDSEIALIARIVPATDAVSEVEAWMLRDGDAAPAEVRDMELGPALDDIVRGALPAVINEMPARLCPQIAGARMPLESLLAYPFRGPSGSVDVLIAVGNRPVGYDSREPEHQAPLLSTCAALFSALGERLPITFDGSARSTLLEQMQQGVACATNLNDALEAALRVIGTSSGWPLGQAWVQRFDRKELQYAGAFYGAVPNAHRFRDSAAKAKTYVGEGIVGTVWAEGTARLVKHLGEAEGDGGLLATATESGFDAGFWIPIRVDCGTVAVLEFFAPSYKPQDSASFETGQWLANRLAPTFGCKLGEHYRQLYEAVMKTVKDGVVIVAVDGGRTPNVEAANDAFERITGTSSADLDHLDAKELLPNCDACPGGCAETRDDLCGMPERRKLKTQYGADVDTQLRSAPVFDHAGWPTHVVSAVRRLPVVQDQRRATVEPPPSAPVSAVPNAAAAQFGQTFEMIDVPSIMVDGEGRIVRLSRGARELLGDEGAELIGQPLERFAQREPYKQALPLLSAALGGAGEDGRRDSKAPNRESRPIAASTGAIVTARLQHSLQRSQGMKAFGSLVAGVAQEVLNPLFGISATLDAFEAQFDPNSVHQKFLIVLRAEANRLAKLMGTLLEYGRPPGLTRSATDLRTLIAAAVENSTPEATRRRVAVKYRPADAEQNAEVDQARIDQVIANLLDNAIHHSPEKGTVLVECNDYVDADGSKHLKVDVLDEGPSIDKEDLPRMWEPFFSKRRGNGLRLSIVQQIVEQHGGRVEATNRPTKGARFSILLPLEAKDAAPVSR